VLRGSAGQRSRMSSKRYLTVDVQFLLASDIKRGIAALKYIEDCKNLFEQILRSYPWRRSCGFTELSCIRESYFRTIYTLVRAHRSISHRNAQNFVATAPVHATCHDEVNAAEKVEYCLVITGGLVHALAA
jgi:hypothetical protein